MNVVRCTGCGGTVRMVAGEALPSCLFCGAAAADLVPTDPPEDLEQPTAHLPFALGEAEARERFRTFASSSWWYPSDLRHARVVLRRLLSPAWVWSGSLETHWTGLQPASSASGKAPVAGVDVQAFPQVLVPASATLRMAELRALGRWDESRLAPFDPETSPDPIELSETTRSAAEARVRAEMEERRAAAIRAAHRLTTIRTSALATDLVGRPVLVPVYIGAFRYRDRTWRFLVHGQNGTFVGDAPYSPWKVLFVVLLVLALVGTAALAVSVCAGLGAVATQL